MKVISSIHGMNVSFRIASILIVIGLVGIILYVKGDGPKERIVNVGKFAAEANDK